MKNVSIVAILLLMSSFCFSQNGSIPEYPKQIVLDGQKLTVITDEYVKELNQFHIDFKECEETSASLSSSIVRVQKLLDKVSEERKVRELELEAQKKIAAKDKELLTIANTNVVDLTSRNKSLSNRIGLLGGVVVVLTVLTGVLALK